MEIKINEYYGVDHFKEINEDNYNVSRTKEDERDMHHIHNSCEILFVEDGSAYYYVSGNKYFLEPHDIMVIGAREHHRRRMDKPPFLRYGLTLNPSYYKSLMLGNDLIRVLSTPSVESYNQYYKKIPSEVFDNLISMLCELREEEQLKGSLRSQMERTIITKIIITLFRMFGFKANDTPLSSANVRMLEIREYIDFHYSEKLDLKILSEKFFMHPTSISKDFHKYNGYNLNKYINMVRICEGAKLLESSNKSIAVISLECGYDSVNTFLRQFKEIMEISPLQYRKSLQELFKKARKNL